MSTKPRFRKERLKSTLDAAREAGGVAVIDLVAGTVKVDFRPANDPAPEAAPAPPPGAAERQRKMADRMRQPPSPTKTQ